jgi:16S rRNA (guanine(966)-N(2))-methyltransferase RsmD
MSGGLDVRPTSDRLRETLFNILSPKVVDSRFLDICAGSGAVGIEALSRGAIHSTFIERSRRACAVIEANLKTLEISQAAIVNRDALSALKRFQETRDQFEIIFFDPPYASELYAKAMELLGVSDLLASEGVIVVEHRVKSPTEAQYGGLRIFREVTQGESALTFYARA